MIVLDHYYVHIFMALIIFVATKGAEINRRKNCTAVRSTLERLIPYLLYFRKSIFRNIEHFKAIFVRIRT